MKNYKKAGFLWNNEKKWFDRVYTYKKNFDEKVLLICCTADEPKKGETSVSAK